MKNLPNGVARAITDAVVRRLAGPLFYQRGLDYFARGHVKLAAETADGIRAIVRGGQDYAVVLTADEDVLDYSCDCPVGETGAFCKHCVAVALAVLNRKTGSMKSSPRKTNELTLA